MHVQIKYRQFLVQKSLTPLTFAKYYMMVIHSSFKILNGYLVLEVKGWELFGISIFHSNCLMIIFKFNLLRLAIILFGTLTFN